MKGRDKLENAGFQVRGVAQALHAMATSETCVHEIGWALDILAKAATGAADSIDGLVASNRAETE